MTTTFTANLKLSKPDFRSPGWADAMNGNWDAIDTAIRNVLMNTIPWANLTTFSAGQVVVDTVPNPAVFWICVVTHTSAAGPATFAQERLANPGFWTAFSFGIKARGAWTNDTAYAVNDIAYDSVRGITGICITAHVSNHAGSIQDDATDWSFIVNLPTVFTATATNYDNSTTHLSATNVQAAIDAIFANVAGAYIAVNNTYDSTASGLGVGNVQAAIDALKALREADLALINANTVAIATGLISTGFPHWRPTSEILAGWVVANGLTIGNAASLATGRANADTAALYAWHWNNFSNTQCPVSTGRGANPAADFAANKTITVLDMKGTMGGLGIDTMGGAATTRLTGVPAVSGNATTPGSVLGENLHTNTLAELPTGITAVNAAQAISVTTLTSDIVRSAAAFQAGVVLASGGNAAPPTGNVSISNLSSSGSNSISVTSNNTSGTPAPNVSRAMNGTWYLKL